MTKTIYPFPVDTPEVSQEQADYIALGVYFSHSKLVADLTDDEYEAITEHFARLSGLTRSQMTEVSLLASKAGHDAEALAVQIGDVVGRYPAESPSEQYTTLQDRVMATFGSGDDVSPEALAACFEGVAAV